MSRRRSRGRSYRSSFPRYVPVAERKARAERAVKDRLKRGQEADPVVIEGRGIATTFWGKAWCDNLEAYSDFSSRLPRGRSYARNGSIVHLDVRGGRISALVAGSSLYEVSVEIQPLASRTWEDIRAQCAGRIGSLVELLGGQLSDQVMATVSKPGSGLFPAPKEIAFSCTCPDFASLCKHTAATFYGVGARLDREPELLFSLRGVSARDLVTDAVERAAAPTTAPTSARVLGEDTDLFELFGIEGEAGAAPPPPANASAANASAAKASAAKASTANASAAKASTAKASSSAAKARTAKASTAKASTAKARTAKASTAKASTAKASSSAAKASRSAAKARTAKATRDEGVGFLGGWSAALGSADEPAQRWLTLQAESLGYDDTEAAKRLGISKRRAQSVKVQALDAVRAQQPWLDELNARVSTAVSIGTRPLAELAADLWWSGVNRAPGPTLLGFLLDEVLEAEAHVFEFAGQGYLTRHDEDAALDAAEGFTQHRRIPAATFTRAVRKALGASDPVLEALARSHLDVLRRRKG